MGLFWESGKLGNEQSGSNNNSSTILYALGLEFFHARNSKVCSNQSNLRTLMFHQCTLKTLLFSLNECFSFPAKSSSPDICLPYNPPHHECFLLICWLLHFLWFWIFFSKSISLLYFISVFWICFLISFSYYLCPLRIHYGNYPLVI